MARRMHRDCSKCDSHHRCTTMTVLYFRWLPVMPYDCAAVSHQGTRVVDLASRSSHDSHAAAATTNWQLK